MRINIEFSQLVELRELVKTVDRHRTGAIIVLVAVVAVVGLIAGMVVLWR